MRRYGGMPAGWLREAPGREFSPFQNQKKPSPKATNAKTLIRCTFIGLPLYQKGM